MLSSLFSIATVLFLLFSGYLVGKCLPLKWVNTITAKISLLVMLLIFCMGIDFGQIFINPNLGKMILVHALTLAGMITVITGIILYRPNPTTSKPTLTVFFTPISGCLKVILAFLLGIAFFYTTQLTLSQFHFSSSDVLYLVIFLIGMDLIHFHLAGLNQDVIIVPLLAIFATVLSAGLFSLLSDFPFKQALLVSSGYGWFSLSGPLVSQLISPEMGAMAFMTDFLREIFSILFLFMFGKTQPRSAIGVAGATAMDSVLPFIKKNCHPDDVRYAMISGLLLTLLVPLLISILAGWIS